MKLTKHVPGPWRYDPDNLNVYANGLLAQVYGYIHDGEKEANARLIAAAPDLLEALKAVMGLLDSGYLVRNIDNDHEQGWAMKQIEPVSKLKSAIDAIAKAEGHQ